MADTVNLTGSADEISLTIRTHPGQIMITSEAEYLVNELVAVMERARKPGSGYDLHHTDRWQVVAKLGHQIVFSQEG